MEASEHLLKKMDEGKQIIETDQDRKHAKMKKKYLNMHNPKWSCIVKSIKFEDDSFMSIREKMGVAQYVQLHTTGHGNL